MKTFRYTLGHKAGTTVTVGELIDALSDYAHNMPVMAQWEGVDAFVRKENFSVKHVDKGHDDDACDCLIIDVNQYS